MRAISLELPGRLPRGLQQLYRKVDEAASSIGCEYLVIGAIARDMVLVHGFGANLERGTRDVDFGVNVPSWDAFSRLKTHLLGSGLTADEHAMQKLHFESDDRLPWEIDIVPFGALEDAHSAISWPPKYDVTMSTLGFREALNDAFRVLIAANPDLRIRVASPAGLCLLKLIAWLDRPAENRAKDAVDIRYLIDTYTRIPQIQRSLYDDGFMESQDWHEDKASAMKLGSDVRAIISADTLNFLQLRLFSHDDNIESMAREMSTRGSFKSETNLELLEILLRAIRQ